MINPKDWFHYDPETGTITWSKDRGRKIKAGQQICGHDKDGYLRAKLDGKTYKAHRLAWYLYHGIWPSFEIDHINRCRDDNRIENLRDVPRRTNGQNIKNFCGVARKHNGWQAQTQRDGKNIYIGFHKTKEGAIKLYEKYTSNWLSKE